MPTNRRKRPWVAVLLALVYPGLGHLYLREWFRSLLWFGLVITASTVLIPESFVPDTLSVKALAEASRHVPEAALAAMLAITVLSMVDAYWVATRTGPTEQPETCPNCGKEIDPELTFCHWCTQPLADDES